MEELEEFNYTLYGYQDNCLIKLSEGNKPPEKALRKLTPWRAVMIARIAEHMGVMTLEEVTELVDEARRIGGAGTLSLKPEREIEEEPNEYAARET